MSAEGQKGRNQAPAGPVRTVAVVTLVGLLLLLPAAAVYLSVGGTVRGTSLGGSSDLGVAWGGGDRINFVETGLASGTTWSVNLAGSLGSSNGTTISFSETAGTYSFTVTPVVGYTASPSSGNVTLSQCSKSATVYITFTKVTAPPAYSVTFNETGLATDTTWWVDFEGTNTSSATSSISFLAANGTYTFTDAAVLSGGPGIQFLTTVNNGTVVVNGVNLTVVIPYTTQYYLTMIAYPSTEGTVAPSSGWQAAGASVDLSAVPASGYSFANWTGVGNGNYSGVNATPTITMNGPITENGTFGVAYAVQFEEHGLPDGTVWSVTFNGATVSAYFVFLDFSAVNGTYNFTVAPIPGFHADHYHGNVTVAGADVTVMVYWTQVTYNVTFAETGLPSGTSWSVTLNTTPESSVTNSIVFVEPNGTMSYTVAPISGYTANVTGGSVDVHGANQTVYILWTANSPPPQPKTYSITFIEAGLPSATTWSVALNGTSSVTHSSSTGSVVFTGIANGRYTYWVPTVGSYAPEYASETVTVSGANVTVDVSFSTTSAPAHPASSMYISLLDLIVVAFIIGSGVTITYLIFRRT
jgi:hypothetical protein